MSDFDEAKFEADEEFWSDPQAYIQKQISAGVRNQLVNEMSARKLRDDWANLSGGAPAERALELEEQHKAELTSMTNDEKLRFLAEEERKSRSLGGIVSRRKSARREARLGYVARQSKT